MNLILRRYEKGSTGVFGKLIREADGVVLAETLEHSYEGVPKLQDGSYTCVRGIHRLAGHNLSFETFEIKDVPDFLGKKVSGILFHVGNFNHDSNGCVLLGKERAGTMILRSVAAFGDFIAAQEGVREFSLRVETYV